MAVGGMVGRSAFSIASRIQQGLSVSRAGTLANSVSDIRLDQTGRDTRASTLKQPGDANLVHQASCEIRRVLNQGGPHESRLDSLVKSGKLGEVDLSGVITSGQKLGGPELMKMQAVDSLLSIMRTAAEAFTQEDGEGQKSKLTEQQQKLVDGQKALERKLQEIIDKASSNKRYAKSVDFDKDIKNAGDKAVNLLNQNSPEGNWIESHAEAAIKITLECASLMEVSTEIYNTVDNMMLGAYVSFEDFCSFRVALTTLPVYLYDGGKAEAPQDVESAAQPIPLAQPPGPPPPHSVPSPGMPMMMPMMMPMPMQMQPPPMQPMSLIPIYHPVGSIPSASDSLTINISIDPSVDPDTTSTSTQTAKKGADRQTSTDSETEPHKHDWKKLKHVKPQDKEDEPSREHYRGLLKPVLKGNDTASSDNKDEHQSGAVKKDKRRREGQVTHITNNYYTNHHHHYPAAAANPEPPPQQPEPPPEPPPVIHQLKGRKPLSFSGRAKPSPKDGAGGSFNLKETPNGKLLWKNVSVSAALTERDPSGLDDDELVDMVKTALGSARTKISRSNGPISDDPGDGEVRRVLVDYMLLTEVNPLNVERTEDPFGLQKETQKVELTALPLRELVAKLRAWAGVDARNSPVGEPGPTAPPKINYSKGAKTLRRDPASFQVNRALDVAWLEKNEKNDENDENDET